MQKKFLMQKQNKTNRSKARGYVPGGKAVRQGRTGRRMPWTLLAMPVIPVLLAQGFFVLGEIRKGFLHYKMLQENAHPA